MNCLTVCCIMAEHNAGHELMVMGNGTVPRPEEDRLTLAEKSERLNQQLKVRIHRNSVSFTFLTVVLSLYTGGFGGRGHAPKIPRLP